MIGLFLPERRTQQEGYGPTADFWYGPVTRQTSSGIAVSDEEALTYSAVWACTRLLSATAGRLPLNLYRRGANRGKAVALGDRRDRLVFRRPNALSTPMLYKSQGFIQQINGGNSYSEIQWDGDGVTPFAFWPIHNSRVKPVIDRDTDELYYRVRNNDGSHVDIHSRDMLHFPSMISDDGICGKGVIQNAKESIGMGIATERHGASTFGHGGIPRVVVEAGLQKWTPESRQNFRKEWKEIYGGPDGDRVGVLDAGAKLHVMNIDHEALQFLSTRQHNVEEIARWYGVPPHKIQHLLRATFSNIEHQSIEFITDSLMPWLVIWEEELDRKLLREDEQDSMFFAFNANEYMRGDTVARGQYWHSMVNSGIANRNEARIEEDMNPVEGGDTFLVQGAMVPLDDEGRPPMATKNAAVEEPATDEPPDDDEDDDESPDDDSPGDEPSGSSESARAIAVEVLRVTMEDTIARMIRQEVKAARRAANHPREFLTWMDEFYAKHEEKTAEALAFVETAAAKLSIDFSAASLATHHCEQSKAALLTAAETTADKFAASIEQLASSWETDRAAETVRTFFERAEQ